MQTKQPQEPSSEPSGKAKSFVQSLMAARQETIRKGFHVSHAVSKLVPRSSLNYPAKDSSSTPLGEA